MKKNLEARIHAARKIINDAEDLRNKHPAFDLGSNVSEIIRSKIEFDHWLSLIETRRYAKKQLLDLEKNVAPGDLVLWGTLKDSIPFSHARLLAINAYLSTSWSLTDGITSFIGRIFCSPNQGFYAIESAKLVRNFVEADAVKKSTAGILYNFIPEFYGWPICLSYMLRNVFIHDGGKIKGKTIFKSSSAISAFEISDDAWGMLEVELKAKNPTVNQVAKSATWAQPSRPITDIRAIIEACEQETDEALGVLLGTACHSFGAFLIYATMQD